MTDGSRGFSDTTPSPTSRRGFFARGGLLTLVGAIVAGAYGTLAAMAVRFLYPSRERGVRWQFVTTVNQLREGESLMYQTPVGAKIVIARQPSGSAADEGWIALSSVCPHLGCAVHWEPQNQRFFCPCHNGAFDPSGKATEGPPAKANQSLMRYPLRVDQGRLFIEVPLLGLDGPREVG